MPTATIGIARAKATPGWMKPTELVWLAEAATRARTIVEIGSWQGRSTRALADHTTGTVYAVDPWSGDYPADDGSVSDIRTDVSRQFKAHLRDHIASGRVVPVQMTASVAARTLFDVGGLLSRAPLDLVFIDGDHRYEAVLDDIDNYLPLVRSGGILGGHDYGHKRYPGVKRAVDARFPQAQFCQSIWWVTV